jgi:dTDP-4-dehydrorhamnose reductase
MHIVILGKGFIGNNLSHFFAQNNIAYKAYSQKELNYTNQKEFRTFLEKENGSIRCIVNCSGYTGNPNVDACEVNKETCYNYNVIYPLNVVTACHEYSVPIIHVGSGCIYSGYEKQYTETDTPNFGLYCSNSSFYSKCKHIFETLVSDYDCKVLRIRIPFTADSSRKNYLVKLLKYDTLINEENSITSVSDFNNFIIRAINNKIPKGIYNVVNTGSVKAFDVVELLKKYNNNNPNWSFIETKDLNTVAQRSNCVLSTNKIESLGLQLPNALESLERDIKNLNLY